MDVSVATMSKGQRTFEKTKEKTKNNVGLIATGAVGVGATIGTGKFVEKAVEAKDKVDLKNRFESGCVAFKTTDGKPPIEVTKPLTKCEKFLAKIAKSFETFYDKTEIKYHNSNFGKTIKEMTEGFKELSNDKRGAILIAGAVGAASVIATAAKAITTHFKNKQIEQKYN